MHLIIININVCVKIIFNNEQCESNNTLMIFDRYNNNELKYTFQSIFLVR